MSTTPTQPQQQQQQTQVPFLTRFTDLANQRPDLTIAQILNSNNYTLDEINSGSIDLAGPPKIPQDADIVVAGAGIASLMYAIHVKKTMPEANIVILEKASSPTYKIGESTLSPFSRFCQSHILPVGYMLRLFNLKEGLDFVLLDRNGKDAYYQDIGGLDYSFQLERKVSELLLTLKAQRMGVKVFYGVSVDGTNSDITSTDFKTISYTLTPSVGGSNKRRSVSEKPLDVKVSVAINNESPLSPTSTSTSNRNKNRMSVVFPNRPYSMDSVRNAGGVVTPPPSVPTVKAPMLMSWLFGKKKSQPQSQQQPPRSITPTSSTTRPQPQIPEPTVTLTLPHIKAKIVADGTGLAKTLARKEAKTEPFDGINFSSYWGYFKEDMNVMDDTIKDWLYPATNHICIPEGWSWW
ncbi:hypothetical protein HDU76_007248, partial [Blyttiomyces sp. JEL0837]